MCEKHMCRFSYRTLLALHEWDAIDWNLVAQHRAIGDYHIDDGDHTAKDARYLCVALSPSALGGRKKQRIRS